MCDGKNPTSLQSMKTQLEQYQTTKFKNERNVQALLTRTINKLDYFFRDFINPYADLTKSSFICTLRSTNLHLIQEDPQIPNRKNLTRPGGKN